MAQAVREDCNTRNPEAQIPDALQAVLEALQGVFVDGDRWMYRVLRKHAQKPFIAALKAIYQRTQQWFREHRIQLVPVFRGVVLPASRFGAVGQEVWETGKPVLIKRGVQSEPIARFTLNPLKALQFVQEVLELEDETEPLVGAILVGMVPAQEVLCAGETTCGIDDEVVLRRIPESGQWRWLVWHPLRRIAEDGVGDQLQRWLEAGVGEGDTKTFHAFWARVFAAV